MTDSLVHLLGAAPPWVEASVTSPGTANLCVRPPRASGIPASAIDLVLHMGPGGEVSIAEQQPGSVLPACCPERHINTDGTFCVHLGSTDVLATRVAAGAWWESLRVFLISQDYAHRHRAWPLHSQLSHGHEAARVQLKMEALAEPLGWLEEVHLGIFRREGWLGSGLPRVRVHGGEVGQVPNARTPCPRGCRMSGRRLACRDRSVETDMNSEVAPVLRVNCPNRSTLETLIRLEHHRRYYETWVTRSLKADGLICCGTMARCGLAKRSKPLI